MRSVWVRRGAVVCAIWTLLLVAAAAAEFGFSAHEVGQQYDIWWSCGVGIMVLTTAAVLLWPARSISRIAHPRDGRAANGAAGPALAVACLFAGLAWVWGVYLVYFSVPLIAFCLARWRVEWAERRAEKEAG